MNQYQPQYWSTNNQEWCNIQGYKDDESKGTIAAKTNVHAMDKFYAWIQNRFKTHDLLRPNDWCEFDYRVEEVKP